ncbi:hypothetical protein FA95DRAFT_1505698, partial [Auriscalpium vulgare]
MLPDTAAALKKSLLDGYTCPPVANEDTLRTMPLDQSEKLSLKHWVAWKRSNGTVQAYIEHGLVLAESTGAEILSLYNVRKLASKATGLQPQKTDICLNSCLAYTGEFKELASCPYKKHGVVCNQPRYKPTKKPTSVKKPRAQMLSLPIIPTIQALFANADTAELMRSRDRCLKETLTLLAEASGVQKHSDFANGTVHIHHYKKSGLFEKERDIGFALSTDGAQLTMKKQSDTWVLILEVLNFPPELRYKASNVVIPLAIPGPQPPGNVESFL